MMGCSLATALRKIKFIPGCVRSHEPGIQAAVQAAARDVWNPGSPYGGAPE
jgi:hypothetical protein